MDNKYAFLFDLDGTLVFTDMIYLQVWTIILKKYNLFMTPDIFFNQIQGKTDIAVIKQLFPSQNINISEISLEKDKLFIENIHKIRMIDGSCEFIKYLKSHGHKVCIVTNCNRLVAETIINHINIAQYIDKLIIGNECTNSKPYPDPYLEAIKYLNIEPNQCIIFEDSCSGIKSGLSAQVKCVCGLETFFNKFELLNMGVSMTISNYLNLNINQFIKHEEHYVNLKKIIALKLNTDETNIIIDDIKLKGGFISDTLKFKQYINNSKSTCSALNYVIKLENKTDSFMTIIANELDLYNREYYFYQTISEHININIPKNYGIVHDYNNMPIGIIMEDLFESNYVPNLNLNFNIDLSLKIISECAKMHSKFWNKNLTDLFPFLKKHNNQLYNPGWNNFITNQWPLFKNKWSQCLTNKQLEIGEHIVVNFQKIQNNLSVGNLTLCHGDVKSPNIFYSKINNDPCFIDWQYIAHGKGIQDIIFFMIESFDNNVMDEYYHIFINYYYRKLLEFGIVYEKTDYENDIVNSICYFPFYVAIWFGTTEEKDLIDKNFPFFFINKLFYFIEKHVRHDYIF